MTAAHAAGARLRAETLEATRLAAIRSRPRRRALRRGAPRDPRGAVARRGGRKRSRRRAARGHPARGERRCRARRRPDTADELGMVRQRTPAPRGPQRARRMGRRRPAGRRTSPASSPATSRRCSPSRSPRAGPSGRSATRTWPCRPSCGAARPPPSSSSRTRSAASPGPADVPAAVRETLGAWLECACSAAETARRLHLSERTVRYHLQRAADLRGRPLDEDLPALATALRIADQLPGKD